MQDRGLVNFANITRLSKGILSAIQERSISPACHDFDGLTELPYTLRLYTPKSVRSLKHWSTMNLACTRLAGGSYVISFRGVLLSTPERYKNRKSLSIFCFSFSQFESPKGLHHPHTSSGTLLLVTPSVSLNILLLWPLYLTPLRCSPAAATVCNTNQRVQRSLTSVPIPLEAIKKLSSQFFTDYFADIFVMPTPNKQPDSSGQQGAAATNGQAASRGNEKGGNQNSSSTTHNSSGVAFIGNLDLGDGAIKVDSTPYSTYSKEGGVSTGTKD
ncbi:uncharacterized protein BDR25DRAFT_350367 [Lindgomyces ingoldianus]|uniref:Uncharacterized protein n=1 Tax=Lindgomyces ingoldianus TaxID=673940 RepID=A0ACB6RA05_9PLEO|nr:uncharacterized protein BDR25DRAFT_350367 [Lindgomyces ingoldianus]KAF2476079.1 hypothetical protein BDR25DRAFT_350367 [Lindgomyces ingoldianus]